MGVRRIRRRTGKLPVHLGKVGFIKKPVRLLNRGYTGKP
jgi:hypothetical protein